MSTTSLKLTEDVKQLVSAAARHHGITPHAFMVDAIRVAAQSAEKRAAFIADAMASRAEALETGEGYHAEDVHAYVQARARGKAVAEPKATSWRK